MRRRELCPIGRDCAGSAATSNLDLMGRVLAGLIMIAASLLGADISSLSGIRADNDFFFVQLTDTQFGFHNNNAEFSQETASFEFVIASLNRLKPAFVVVTGDLVNKAGDAAQTAQYIRIAAKLDRSIPLYNLPGNHDTATEPTPEALALYRKKFGADHYVIRYGDLVGIALNSGLLAKPEKAPGAAAEQAAWLKLELKKARESGARHIVAFQHDPVFLEKADEPDQYFNMPLARRRPYLDLLEAAGVTHIFAGHLHRNAVGRDGPLEMVTTGPVGRPLGADPSGIRVVIIRSMGIEHRYYGLGSIPNRIQLSTSAPKTQ